MPDPDMPNEVNRTNFLFAVEAIRNNDPDTVARAIYDVEHAGESLDALVQELADTGFKMEALARSIAAHRHIDLNPPWTSSIWAVEALGLLPSVHSFDPDKEVE